MSAKQVKTGKAFEYSLLLELYEKLKFITNVEIKLNTSYRLAKSYFEEFSIEEKEAYRITASQAINFILDLEPKLRFGINKNDILQLEIVADSEGQSGDVRDVIMIRSLQKWEIGISAKNNHKAVKHSRLSGKLDFGKKWIGVECSAKYFKEIAPIFNKLTDIKKHDKTAKWDCFDNKEKDVYVPILEAFKNELLHLNAKHPNIVAKNLVQYLIGTRDFYKIIKGKGKVEIQAYNLHGTLNQSTRENKPKAKIPKLKFPSRLIDISYYKDTQTTLVVTLDDGWQISFRIHSASSKIESSLKFDVQLISAPESRFKNIQFIFTE